VQGDGRGFRLTDDPEGGFGDVRHAVMVDPTVLFVKTERYVG
jgi:hypothetical protein